MHPGDAPRGEDDLGAISSVGAGGVTGRGEAADGTVMVVVSSSYLELKQAGHAR